MLSKPIAVLLLVTSTIAAADWRDATSRLIPGQRIEVQHNGKRDRGLFALATGSEILITTSGRGSISIPAVEVNRVITSGLESSNLSFFANATNQLFPKAQVVYEREGAGPAAKAGAKSHGWFRR